MTIVNSRTQKMNSLLLFHASLVLAVLTSWSTQAHPNAACQVSAHTTLAATSETDVFVNPQASAIGLDVMVIYQKANENELYAAHGYPNEMHFSEEGGYWDMDVHFDQYEPFVVADTAMQGSARIAAVDGKFLVVYSESDQVVTSKFILPPFDSVEGASEFEISADLEPSSSDLVSGNQSAVYYAAVEGNNVFVYYFANVETTWTQLDTSGLVESVTGGPISIAVASDLQTVMIAYHPLADDTAIVCAMANPGGPAALFQQVSQPGATGTSLALAAGGDANTFMVLTNNFGQIEASFTTDKGETWSLAQIVEPADGDVDVDTPVGLVKTAYKWVPIWIDNVGSVQSKPTPIETPNNSDWAAITKARFFTGTGSLLFSSPQITATGGDGWTLVAVDNRTSDVSFRACFDVPAEETSSPAGEPDRTTPSPTTNAASGLLANPVVGLVLAVIQICILMQ